MWLSAAIDVNKLRSSVHPYPTLLHLVVRESGTRIGTDSAQDVLLVVLRAGADPLVTDEDGTACYYLPHVSLVLAWLTHAAGRNAFDVCARPPLRVQLYNFCTRDLAAIAAKYGLCPLAAPLLRCAFCASSLPHNYNYEHHIKQLKSCGASLWKPGTVNAVLNYAQSLPPVCAALAVALEAYDRVESQLTEHVRFFFLPRVVDAPRRYAQWRGHLRESKSVERENSLCSATAR